MKRYIKSADQTNIYDKARAFYKNNSNSFELFDYLLSLDVNRAKARKIVEDIEDENSLFYDSSLMNKDPNDNGVCFVTPIVRPPIMRNAGIDGADIYYQSLDGRRELYGTVCNGYWNTTIDGYTVLDCFFAYRIKDSNTINFDDDQVSGKVECFPTKKKAIAYLVNLCKSEREVTDVVYEKK